MDKDYERAVKLASQEVSKLENKLLPLFILSVPLTGVVFAELGYLAYENKGVAVGLVLSIFSSYLFATRIEGLFYQPIFDKYKIKARDWEEFYLNSLKGKKDRSSF
jgi:hypothetical protein